MIDLFGQQCSTTCGIGAIWRTVACSSHNDEDCANITRPEPARTCNLQPCANWKSSSWSKVIFIYLFCFQGVMGFFVPFKSVFSCASEPFLSSPRSVQTAVGWWEGDTVMSSVSILRVNVLWDRFTVRMCPAGLPAHWHVHKSPVWPGVYHHGDQ